MKPIAGFVGGAFAGGRAECRDGGREGVMEEQYIRW